MLKEKQDDEGRFGQSDEAGPADAGQYEKRCRGPLGSVEVEGQAGAGMVKVIMTCHHDVKRVAIDPSLMTEDKEMLEDLLAAAVNDANRRVESTVQEKMAGFTNGMGLPPGSSCHSDDVAGEMLCRCGYLIFACCGGGERAFGTGSTGDALRVLRASGQSRPSAFGISPAAARSAGRCTAGTVDPACVDDA